MKNIQITKYLILSMFTLLFFSACKKDYVEPLGDQGQKTIGFLTYGGKAAAAAPVSALALDLSLVRDSVEMRLVYSTPQVSTQDITVTLGFDPAKLTAFNAAQPTGGIIYQPLSATQVMLKTTQVKIRAGQTLSEPFYVIIFNTQLDAAKSYLIPISITKIEGAPADVKAASGTGTAYLRIIGNPLAGNYSVVGSRYNYPGVINYNGGPIPGGTTSIAVIPSPKTISAISPTESTTFYANLGAGTNRDYIFTYDPAVSTTAVGVTFTPSFLAGVSNVRIITATYDPATRVLRLVTTYNNQPGAAGDDRIVVETLTKI